MTFVRGFLLFWYDFIVGDDWRVAFGVVAGLAIGGLLVAIGNLSGEAIALLFLLGLIVSLAVSLRVEASRRSR